jgi:hypothetical protein
MHDLNALFGPDPQPPTNTTCTDCAARMVWARRASALLSGVTDADTRAGLRYEFEERAGVYEYDHDLPRDVAERLAYQHLRRVMRR